MEKEQKSSAMPQKAETKEKLHLVEALDLLGVKGTKRFAALKKFKASEPMNEKEWQKLFAVKRILEK